MAIEYKDGKIVRTGDDGMSHTYEEIYGGTPTAPEPEMSITDYENNPLVIEKFERVTSYLAKQKGLGTTVVDVGAALGKDNIAETMRDFQNRLGTKIAAIQNLKDAPQEIKDDLNFLLQNWEKASPEGAAEWTESVYHNMADFLINPETFAAIGAGIATTPAGGSGGIATKVATTAAKTAATRKLYSVLSATTAASAKNPKTAIAAFSALYGGADDLLMQDLEITTGARKKIDLGQTAQTAFISAGAGVGLYGAGQYIAKGYKSLRNSTDTPQTKPTIKEDSESFDNARQLDLFDDDVDEKILNGLDTPRLDADAPEGTQGTLFDFDNLESPVSVPVVKFVDDLGGGEATKKSILSEIRNISNSQETRKVKRNAIRQVLYKSAAELTANFYGKTAGTLTPFRSVSGTARTLQQKLHHDFGIEGDILKPGQKQEKVVAQDLFEVQREITGRYNERFRAIVDELSSTQFKTKFAKDVNAALSLSVRSSKPITHEGFDEATNKTINRAAGEIKELYLDMGTRLKDIGVIDKLVENYTPRMWSRSAIEKNPEKLVALLVEKGGMNEKGARATVKNMLNVKNQIEGGNGSGHFFSAKRKINEIGDDADFEEFLNTDVLGTLHAYTFQTGKQVAKHRVLGVTNFKQFNQFYINRIRKEVTDAGEAFTEKDAKNLERLYRTQTGEGLERFGIKTQTASDAYSLVNRVAYLPFATLSSLTEIMLNISKAGVRNSVKGLGDALQMSHKRVTRDLETTLKNKHGLTAAESFAEMRKFSIYVDQEMGQLGDRLTGDALINETMQKASNKFFRVNMLDQWTKFVQNVSFRSGKNLINENIEKLSKYGNNPLDSRGKALAGELAELGIDYKKGVTWWKGGAKLDDDFYQKDLLAGTARYVNGVVLQPTGLAGNKPYLLANPKTSILFQLLSYPAAFSNTIIKDMGKTLTKSPLRGGVGRIAPAALLMTGMARWTNYLRTGGDSERNKDMDEIIYDSVARWGGNGLLIDSVNRARDAAKYTNNAAAYLTLPLGPLGSDAMSLYQQGLLPTLGNKVPVYSGSYFGKEILGDYKVRQYKKDLRKAQSRLSDALIPDFKGTTTGIGSSRKEFKFGGVAKVVRGSIMDVLGKKTEVAQTFTDELVSPLANATDNLIKPEKLQEISRKIEAEYSEVLNPENTLAGENLAEAYIINEIKKRNVYAEDIANMPKLKKALESVDLQDAKYKFAEARRKEIATDDEHAIALDTIQELASDHDANAKISTAVKGSVAEIKNVYNNLKVNLTKQDLDKVAEANYDKAAIESLHDFVISRVKHPSIAGDFVSDTGAEKVARDILFKIAARGNIDISKFNPPKIAAKENESVVPLSGEARTEAVDKFLTGSKVKKIIYRARKSYSNREFFMSFAMPREMGTHMGNQGAADNIRLRDLIFDYWKGNEARDLYIGNKNQLTQPETFQLYGELIKEAIQRKKGTPNFDDYIIEEGVVNIKNPLVYKPFDETGENAGKTWDIVEIFTSPDGPQEFLTNIKASGTKITSELVDELEILIDKAYNVQTKTIDNSLDKVEKELMTIEVNIDTQNMLKKLGFDGIEYQNKLEKGYIDDDDISYIAFDPEQFKTLDSAGFDPKDARHRYMSGSKVIAKEIAKYFAPKRNSGMFSVAQKEAASLGKKSVQGDVMLKRLKDRMTQVRTDAEEIKWTGLEEKFTGQKNVTREDLIKHLDENEFDLDVSVGRVSEKEKLTNQPNLDNAVDDMPVENVGDDFGTSRDEQFDNWMEQNHGFESSLMDDMLDAGDDEAFEEMYDELFSQFLRETGEDVDTGVPAGADFKASRGHLEYSFEGLDTKNYREVVLSLPERFKKVTRDYTHDHFPTIKNPVAHVRLSDIEPSKTNKKTLLIDEVQSDAHQQASRKPKNKQYQTEDTALSSQRQAELSDEMDALDAEVERLEKLLPSITDSAEYKKTKLKIKELDDRSNAIDEQLAETEDVNFGIDFDDDDIAVPDLPFKDDKRWGLLGLRQAMKIATDENYDQIALVTGAIQAKRNAKLVTAEQGATLYKNPFFEEGGSEPMWILEGQSEVNNMLFKNFKTFEDAEKGLAKAIGKKDAEKLLGNKQESGEYVLKDPVEFRKGGDKFFSFYDKTLIKLLNDRFGKKYGVQVKYEPYVRNDEIVELPTLEITSKMRKDIDKGLPMFSEGGYVVAKGDTLSKIAKDNNTTVARLAKLNDIKDINKIFVGQGLTLSAEPTKSIAKQVEQVQQAEPVEAVMPKRTSKKPLVQSSRQRTVDALRKNLANPNSSSSRTRKQVAEQRGGGLFNSQVFKNLASYVNPFGQDKTEADYSPEVIEQLKIAARNARKDGRTNIDYVDYSKESNVRAQAGMPQQRTRDRLLTRAFRGQLTPTEEAAFSVGGAQIEVEGDDVFVTDIYDFSKLTDEERTTKKRDRYAYLRDFMSRIPGNEFKSKIKIGTRQEFEL